MNDANIIDTGVTAILDFGGDNLVPHFIYCGFHYLRRKESSNRLQEIFLTKMKSYGIQFLILTVLEMWRSKLVTKETVKKAYQGKMKNDEDWKDYEGSINDDLEKFFASLQDRKNIENEHVFSFFTPKLTEEEMKLVEERNKEHLSSYSLNFFGRNPDVAADEMKRSDSRSKYVHCYCWRGTQLLTLKPNPNQATDKNISKTKCILL